MSEDKDNRARETGRPGWNPMRQLRGARGFTIVELMISVVLLGLISGVIWALFSSTSGAMQEADSFVNSLDKTRFALEQVSADVRSAGAYASPDSEADPWTLPRPSARRVVGLASYSGWQDQTPYDMTNTDFVDAHNGKSGDIKIGFDGFIVLGALDYSTTFELRDMQFTGGGGGSTSVPGYAISARIPLKAVQGGGRFSERGLKKLVINDPFYTETGIFGKSDLDEDSDLIEPIFNNFGSRMIRVMDRQGYVQFGAFRGDRPTWSDGISFNFVQPGLQTKIAGRPFGLQPESFGDEDVGYDAALLDAYWYHVEEDPEKEGNFQLVRDRLDADELTQALAGDWSSISETTLLSDTMLPESDTGTSTRQRTVISDRVVDFQFWVDCASSMGNVQGLSWHNEWVTPDGSEANHNCLDPSSPSPGEARVAHIRLSVRTENERKELGHQGFLDEEGEEDDSTAPLQTYDLNTDAPGATRVVTVQSDIELTNFSYKNITR
ncbi:MAG: PilW family protein [Myxococcota bacterium]